MPIAPPIMFGLDEKKWASVGKFLAITGTLIGLTLGGLNLSDRFRGARLVAMAANRDFEFGPKYRAMITNAVGLNSLKRFVTEKKEKGESESNILQSLLIDLHSTNNVLRERPIFWELEGGLNIVEITLQNNGNEVAKDVKIVCRGEGWADVSATGDSRLNKNALKWTNSMELGMIQPNVVLTVRCHVSTGCPHGTAQAGWWWINTQPPAIPLGHYAR